MSQRRKRSSAKTRSGTKSSGRKRSGGVSKRRSSKSASKKRVAAKKKYPPRKKASSSNGRSETLPESRVDPGASRRVIGERATGNDRSDVDRHAVEAGEPERRTDETGEDEDLPETVRSVEAAFGERND